MVAASCDSVLCPFKALYTPNSVPVADRMSWPSKKAGTDPLLWGRNSISDVIADARASLQQPSRPFTPRNLAQVERRFVASVS